MIAEAIANKAASLDMKPSDVGAFFGVCALTARSWMSGKTSPKPRFHARLSEFFALNYWQPPARTKKPTKAQARAAEAANRKQERYGALRAIRYARAKEMAELYSQGLTLEQVSERYGITRERVRQLILTLGIARKDGGQAVRTQQKRAARSQRADALSVERYGLTRAEYAAIPVKARQAFREQKRNARTRGIEWHMTVAEWWDVWQKSGKWPQRGRGQGYCMGRKGDCGPYSVDNVYICTIGQNFSDSYIWKPAHMRKPKSRNGAPPKMYEYQGRRLTISQWAQIVGLPSGTLSERLRRGMPVDEALTRPIKKTGAHLKRLAREVAA